MGGGHGALAALIDGARRHADELRQDVRLALRVHRRRPGFTLAAIAVLSIGIGATTTIFSGVNRVLLRPFPFDDVDRIVVAWGEQREASRPVVELSWPDVEDWARESRSVERAAAVPFATLGVTLSGTGAPARIAAVPVSAEFFRVLGMDAQLGRGFLPGEDRPERGRLVVLSDGLWRERFGGDPAVLDSAILLDGEPYTVIGVMPPELDFPRGTDAWTSLGGAVPYAADDRGLGFLMMLARLHDDVEPAAAGAGLSAVARRVAASGPFPESVSGAVVTPLSHHVLGATRPASALLLAAAALLLLLATANVASLLLARATSRRHEMAVRSSLGAGRARLVRQLVVESVVLGVAGGLAGVLLALPAVEALVALLPADLPRTTGIEIDATALGAAAGISMVAALASGMLPAFRALPGEGAAALRSSARASADPRSRRALDALIATQVAIALTLLVGAGLLGRSVLHLQQVDLGFDPRQVVSAQVSLPETAYPDLPQQRQMLANLIERLRGLPDVTAAAAVLVRPLEGPVGFNFPFMAERQDSATAATNPLLIYQAVSPGYFDTMRIPLLAGRDFSARDDEEAPGVAIVGAALAERMWAGEHAVGKRLRLPNPRRREGEWLTVVGVVRDVRSRDLRGPGLDVYVPMAQSQFAPQFIVARTRGNPLAVVPAIRSTLSAIDPGVPLARIATMEQRQDAHLSAPRFGSALVATFALAALSLAAVGLYAVLAHAVVQRAREIGIRIALGAKPGDVRALVLGHAGIVVATGAALAVFPIWAGTRAVSRFLFGVGTFDLVTTLAVALILGAATLVATWIPARRAARIDPAISMRTE